MFKKTPLAAALGAVLVMGAADVLAYEAGDQILRVGAVRVVPNEDSNDLKLNGTALAGTKAEVDNDTQLGITYTYMLNEHWGIGVLAATPFKHDLKANLDSVDLGTHDAGSTKHLPPTVSLQYFPLDKDSAIQPYIGVGYNYTKFFDEDVDSDLEGAVSATFYDGAAVHGDLELDESTGLAGEIGVDYAVNDNWLVSAQVWYIDIDTTAKFKFTDGTTVNRVKADVDIDPWVYMLSVGYKF